MNLSFHKPLKYAVLGLVLGSVWLHACATVAAQDSGQGTGGGDGAPDDGGVRERAVYGELLDCREVDCFQRASCNRRVLAALGQIKTTASEVRLHQSPIITHRYI